MSVEAQGTESVKLDHKDWAVGYTQVYTGDGKGKTTAALGLTLRAVGAGYPVYIAQFMKGTDYSELHSVARLSDLITLRQFGSDYFVRDHAGEPDVAIGHEGLRDVTEAMQSGRYRVVVLDEANIAVYFGVLALEELLAVMDAKPRNVELIITGRRAHKRVIEKADLVTEMREVKHYYQRGVMARLGIEN